MQKIIRIGNHVLLCQPTSDKKVELFEQQYDHLGNKYWNPFSKNDWENKHWVSQIIFSFLVDETKDAEKAVAP